MGVTLSESHDRVLAALELREPDRVPTKRWRGTESTRYLSDRS